MVRLAFRQDGDSAIPFLPGRMQIMLVSQCIQRLRRILLRLQFGFLQAQHVRLFLCQPFGQSFGHGGPQTVYVIGYNLHIRIYIYFLIIRPAAIVRQVAIVRPASGIHYKLDISSITFNTVTMAAIV